MKKLIKRIALSFLSDQQIMDLYIGIQLRFVRLKQQTVFAYWLEEATVARMVDNQPGWYDWCLDQQRKSQATYDRHVVLRTILMEARPALFAHHKREPLEGIDVESQYFWNVRPTYQAYRKIMDAKEKAPKGYTRSK